MFCAPSNRGNKTDHPAVLQAISNRLCNHASLTSPLLLWNRSGQVAKDHSAAIGSAQAVDTILDAVVPSDIVWSCLADEEAVSSVYAEIGKANISGKLFIECSTITPSRTDEIARQIEGKGASFVAMPGKW
jgi:3-hydroxyisobutyrate dehydrogenase-like beta-hydroxyacid dehydrogenase